MSKITVLNKEVYFYTHKDEDYICITDIARYKNSNFKPVEFDGFRKQAGLNSSTKDKKGNIRDYANVAQLVCLSNLENLNALFIQEGLSQGERLVKLNKIAIAQMKLLTEDSHIKKLEKGSK